MSYSKRIQVDKPRSRHIQTKKRIYLPLTLNSIYISYEVKHEEIEGVLGFKHMQISKTLPKASFGVNKRRIIHA
jgi:hypothetical protein